MARDRGALNWFVIDADRLGDALDEAARSDSFDRYKSVSQAVDSDREGLSAWVASRGGTVRLAAADGIVGTSDGRIPWPDVGVVSGKFTWSMGQGPTFRAAYAALAAAKRLGRATQVGFDRDVMPEGPSAAHM